MAEAIGIASGIAGLIAASAKIIELSYKLVTDISSAHKTQKQFLPELSALNEVLLHSDEVLQRSGTTKLRSGDISQRVISDCRRELDVLRDKLQKPTPSIFWPIKEKTLRKHVEDLQRFRSVFSHFISAQTLATASVTHHEVSRLRQQQDQQNLMEWLGVPNDSSIPAPTPIDHTCQWFLQSQVFGDWSSAIGPKSLWCHGPPGVGKSMLAAAALQNLAESAPERVCLLSYFCDFANRKEQTKEAIWKTFLSQAIAQGNESVTQVLKDHRQRLGSGRPPVAKDLSEAIFMVASQIDLVVVLDGPDELANPQDLKAILSPFIKASCRILVTSSDLPEIHALFKDASIVEAKASEYDLRAYVISQLQDHGLEDLVEEHPTVQDELIRKANGM
jgi:hypothetical protein